jgi:hypothetical protein
MTAIQAMAGIHHPSKLPEDNNGEVGWCDLVQVSDWLAEILNKMVRYDLLQRYQSATEALQALITTVVSLPVAPLQPLLIGSK